MRVALLARPGTACDNLQAALQQAGAEVVMVADPTGSDAGSVSAARPGAVLVVLDPAVEDVLDRYDPVLLDPAMTVIYDEAELAAKREGWDAARWTRHLAAKLARHDDVLPPGTESDTARSVSAPEPAGQVSHAEATPSPPQARLAPEPELAPAPELAPEPEPAPDLAPAFEPMLEPEIESVQPGGEQDVQIMQDGELSLEDMHFDEAAHVAPVAAEASPDVAAPAAAKPSFDFSALSLEAMAVEDAAPAEAAAPAPEAAEAPPRAMAYEAPSPPMEFAAPPVHAARAEPGAVVVLAGIGGPDAVRQLLAALPSDFARPVLVRQRLDGGRHDRLVRQMQRATSLPVQLAVVGASLAPGHVYILPDAMATTAAGNGGSSFVAAADPVPVLAGLPAAESAVLVLSGSDPATVGEVQAAAADGALVAAQSPEECFDSAATAALIAGGAEAGAPADLASRLSARWHS
jgi:chemosensory pili system protein ChpB (putative protein-glutamate methylesterase)